MKQSEVRTQGGNVQRWVQDVEKQAGVKIQHKRLTQLISTHRASCVGMVAQNGPHWTAFMSKSSSEHQVELLERPVTHQTAYRTCTKDRERRP